MEIGELEVILNDFKRGVYDFTKDNKCSGCGGCCSRYLPISNDEIKRIRGYITRNKIRRCKHTPPTMAQSFDMCCPFLDTTKHDKKCKIYDVRPAICRAFLCNQTAEEIDYNKAVFHQKNHVVDMLEEFYHEQN